MQYKAPSIVLHWSKFQTLWLSQKKGMIWIRIMNMVYNVSFLDSWDIFLSSLMFTESGFHSLWLIVSKCRHVSSSAHVGTRNEKIHLVPLNFTGTFNSSFIYMYSSLSRIGFSNNSRLLNQIWLGWIRLCFICLT